MHRVIDGRNDVRRRVHLPNLKQQMLCIHLRPHHQKFKPEKKKEKNTQANMKFIETNCIYHLHRDSLKGKKRWQFIS